MIITDHLTGTCLTSLRARKSNKQCVTQWVVHTMYIVHKIDCPAGTGVDYTVESFGLSPTAVQQPPTHIGEDVIHTQN